MKCTLLSLLFLALATGCTQPVARLTVDFEFEEQEQAIQKYFETASMMKCAAMRRLYGGGIPVCGKDAWGRAVIVEKSEGRAISIRSKGAETSLDDDDIVVSLDGDWFRESGRLQCSFGNWTYAESFAKEDIAQRKEKLDRIITILKIRREMMKIWNGIEPIEDIPDGHGGSAQILKNGRSYEFRYPAAEERGPMNMIQASVTWPHAEYGNTAASHFSILAFFRGIQFHECLICE